MDDVTIAIIEKSQTSDTRVRLTTFHNKTYIDIRQFVPADAQGHRRPDKAIARRHCSARGGRGQA